MSDERATTRDLAEGPRGALNRWLLRAGVALLVLVVAAGAVGLAGPRAGTTTGGGAGYTLDVTYPAISRAGEPAPLQVRVTATGGFDGPVALSMCEEYFDDLDFQNWYPNPATEVGEGDTVVYEFDPPTGDVLELDLDARAAPGQFGEVEDCRIELLSGDVPVARVDFDTWRLP